MKKLLLAGAILAIGISTAAAQRSPIGTPFCASKACVYWVYATGKQGSCTSAALQSLPAGAPCACRVRVSQSPAAGTPFFVPYQGVVTCLQRVGVRRR